MPKQKSKHRPFSWFQGRDQRVMVRVPEFDVTRVLSKDLKEVMNAPRTRIPNHMGLLGEDGQYRYAIGNGADEAKCGKPRTVLAMDVEVMDDLRRIGAKMLPHYRNCVVEGVLAHKR